MIEKKTWMPIFQWMLDGRKNVEVRLADFDLNEGDEILFREWDQNKKEYTGREFTKRVKFLCEVDLLDFYCYHELVENPLYVMELESISSKELRRPAP